MDEKQMQEVMSTITQLRAEVDKSLPDQEKMVAMHKSLDTLEEANQKAVAAQLEQEKTNLGLKEQLEGLETQLARRVDNTGKKNSYRDTAEYKALEGWMIGGDAAVAQMDEEIKSALRTDIDPQGGFLVPTEMDNVILKKITEISAIRSIARVRTTSGKTLVMPVRAGIPEAEYEGEGETGTESNSTYESETITPFRLTFTAPATLDMLMDAAFNMESELLADAAEAFAFKEGKKFVNGTGVKQPDGFLNDARVIANMITSGTSGQILADDILKLTGELKTGYNPTFVLNRRTLAQLRTERSTTGSFIWQPGINGVVQNTLAGERYLIADEMPDIASGSKSIAFGDFLRGYTIIDRTGMSVIRDEFTAKRQGIVEFTFNKWNTGRVTLPEALTGIITKA